MQAALADLLNHPLLWRGDALARTASVLSTGFAALDRELPGGGWPRGQLTEILADGQGIGELRLLVPSLRGLVREGGWIALVSPPLMPYAPAFARAGIDPARVIVIAPQEDNDRWWAAEQVLRANASGALLFWPRHPVEARLRRLQLAAQEGDAAAFLFAPAAHARSSSPSPLRLCLAALDAPRLEVDIFKRRGGMMSAPLRLALAIDAGAGLHAGDADLRPQPQGGAPAEPPARPRAIPLPLRVGVRAPLSRPPGFARRHAVEAPQARIWNRALARADELRRVPGHDPRSGDPARLALPSRRGRPLPDPARECH